MNDLRREIASRLRTALHGREIDMMENRVELPHMLGITPIGKVHDPHNEEMTILDTKHHFWKNYHETVNTKSAVTEKIETAIRSLKKDDIFRMTYPYGREAEVAYVEVDEMNAQPEATTTCAECDGEIVYELELVNNGSSYFFEVELDCPECDFAGTFEHSVTRA